MARPRFRGTLVKWNDARGFGFIEPDADPRDRIFLHVESYRSPERPKVGDRVDFELQKRPDGRYRAVWAHPESVARRPNARGHLGRALMAILCFFASIWVALESGFVWLIFLYPVGSLTTLIAYWLDKAAAQESGQRVSEETLHMFELLGGWPGALIGQQALRHKTVKESYQRVFSAITWVHTLGWPVAVVLTLDRS